MSSANPIAVIIFDHCDNAILHTSNYIGYIPRKSEMIFVDRKSYEVSTVVYLYEDNVLEEVHIITIERRI